MLTFIFVLFWGSVHEDGIDTVCGDGIWCLDGDCGAHCCDLMAHAIKTH